MTDDDHVAAAVDERFGLCICRFSGRSGDGDEAGPLHVVIRLGGDDRGSLVDADDQTARRHTGDLLPVTCPGNDVRGFGRRERRGQLDRLPTRDGQRIVVCVARILGDAISRKGEVCRAHSGDGHLVDREARARAGRLEVAVFIVGDISLVGGGRCGSGIDVAAGNRPLRVVKGTPLGRGQVEVVLVVGSGVTREVLPAIEEAHAFIGPAARIFACFRLPDDLIDVVRGKRGTGDGDLRGVAVLVAGASIIVFCGERVELISVIIDDDVPFARREGARRRQGRRLDRALGNGYKTGLGKGAQGSRDQRLSDRLARDSTVRNRRDGLVGRRPSDNASCASGLKRGGQQYRFARSDVDFIVGDAGFARLDAVSREHDARRLDRHLVECDRRARTAGLEVTVRRIGHVARTGAGRCTLGGELSGGQPPLLVILAAGGLCACQVEACGIRGARRVAREVLAVMNEAVARVGRGAVRARLGSP